jgi:hypothetical protein
MRAFLIDGESQTIEALDLDSMGDIAALVGFDSVISDEVDDRNAVHFDEDCFIRGTPGRFRIDRLAPIAGKAVITGKVGDGVAADSSLDPEDLKARIEFL